MRSGVVGLMPPTVRQITAATATRLRSLGFSGVTVTIPRPLEARRDECERAGAILHDGGIAVAQVNPSYEMLVQPDNDLRALGIHELQAACRCAAWLQAATVYVRPGSLNPAGPWTPYPGNTSLRTLLRLVDALRQVAPAAEDVGIPLALEGASTSPLDTPERVRDVIEAVDSPAVRFNADPVNFVRSLDELYDTTSLIDRLFDCCGRYTVCSHAKDITYDNALPVRMRECQLGTGLLDHEAYVRRFEQCCPDGFMLIEHLPDEQISSAKQHLDQVVAQAGLRWQAPTVTAS
ncbi:MAG: sugar phosphate isomerase/epimerase family protein [Chloroflexota bacterium]